METIESRLQFIADKLLEAMGELEQLKVQLKLDVSIRRCTLCNNVVDGDGYCIDPDCHNYNWADA